MNRLTSFFHTHFASETLTPGTRLIALGLLILQAPLVILSILLFFLLPLTFPGLIFYYCYWRMYQQTISRAAARAAWVGTILYAAFLWILSLTIGGEFNLYAFLPFAAISSIALIAWIDLRDQDAAELEESLIIS
jgi:hypothetical protein